MRPPARPHNRHAGNLPADALPKVHAGQVSLLTSRERSVAGLPVPSGGLGKESGEIAYTRTGAI